MFRDVWEHVDDSAVLSCLQSQPNERLQSDIARLKKRLAEQVNPRFVTAEFPIKHEKEGVLLVSTPLVLEGSSIKKVLAHSKRCILLAATLGAEADRLIAYTQKSSISDGVVMDAIANVAIEACCDIIERDVATKHLLTMRYSPGYGDLPLETQPKLLALLRAQQTIGLYCNQSNLLIPMKSVTAVWGVADELHGLDACEDCLLQKTCSLRREGKRCGH